MKRINYSVNLIRCFCCFFLLTSLSLYSNAYPAQPTYSDTVQKIYIGYYQRAADPAGLIYWAGRLDGSGGNLGEIIEAFANSDESQALHGTVNSGNISTVVNDVYNALLARDAEVAGRDYYVSGFNSGQFTAATIMLNVMDGAKNEDLQSINNKLTGANLFTMTIDPDLDGNNFQVTYTGEGDAVAGRNFLTLYATSTKIPTQAETTLFIKNNIANPGDPMLRPKPDQMVWVSHYYSGGISCQDPYQPPNIRVVLNQLSITVLDAKIESYATCMACDICPDYAAMHYALIYKDDLSKANSLGFTQNNPPPYL